MQIFLALSSFADSFCRKMQFVFNKLARLKDFFLLKFRFKASRVAKDDKDKLDLVFIDSAFAERASKERCFSGREFDDDDSNNKSFIEGVFTNWTFNKNFSARGNLGNNSFDFESFSSNNLANLTFSNKNLTNKNFGNGNFSREAFGDKLTMLSWSKGAVLIPSWLLRLASKKPKYSLFSLSGILTILFDCFFILLIGMCFYLAIPIKSEKIIFIPQGSTRAIITYLQDKGYNLSVIDAYFLRLIGRPQSGWIELPDETLSRGEFLYALANSKAAMKSVTLIPGETNFFFLRNIAKAFQFNIDELEYSYNKYAPYSDGVILANTYSLPYHATPDFIMQTLISQSLEKHKALSTELLGHYDEKQWFQIIAKASIIQKEAADSKEMPIVSSVIDNRIAKNMPLQMDGSLNYGKYSHARVTPDRIRNDTSEFNTYKHKGIPNTPSGSVSIEAIKAAINPANTNYLYFMRNKNGTHDFTESYKTHLNNIKNVKN